MSVIAHGEMEEQVQEHVKAPLQGEVEEEEDPSQVGLEGVLNQKEEGALPPLESLTCQLCKTYFTEPVTLPCMHSFCKSCLESYNGQSLDQLDDEEDEEENEEEPSEQPGQQTAKVAGEKEEAVEEEPKAIYCPTCKDHLHLGSEAAHFTEPFPNARLKRVVQLLHDSKILCENCQSTASEFRCNVCDSFVCDVCFKATHNAPIFQSHKPERLTHSEMTAPPKCEAHRLNDIEYFCPDDEIGVCSLCLLKGEFKGKEYALISDVRKQRQEEIEQGVSEALVQRANLIQGKKDIEDTIEMLAANLADQEASVRENFALIRKALDERERQTIAALQNLHNKKKDVLDTQIEAIETQKNRIEDGVANVNTVLNHSNDIEVVYLTYVLNNLVKSLSDVPSTSPQGGKRGEPNHEPAVDADLPVVLSAKVPELVMAYAAVPDSSLVEEIARGQLQASQLRASGGTKEQREMFQQVAGNKADAGEYGCTIQ